MAGELLAYLACSTGGAVFGALGWRAHLRRSMNEALHELRRPLAGLALAAEGPGAGEWIEQLRWALTEVDRRLNGRPRTTVRGPAEARRATVADLLEEAALRWTRFAEVEFAPVEVGFSGRLDADGVRLGAALDNLVANALEHGGGPVRVRARRDRRGMRVEVESPGAPGDRRRRRDPRHGHGLRVAGRIAAEAGGSLIRPRERAGTVSAAVLLPVEEHR